MTVHDHIHRLNPDTIRVSADAEPYHQDWWDRNEIEWLMREALGEELHGDRDLWLICCQKSAIPSIIYR